MLRILVNLPKLGNACSGSPAAAAASGGESVRRIRAPRYGADSDFAIRVGAVSWCFLTSGEISLRNLPDRNCSWCIFAWTWKV